MENISINTLQKKHEGSFTSQLLYCLPSIYHTTSNASPY